MMDAGKETNGRKVENTVEAIRKALEHVIPANLRAEDVVFVCIGTDRSTGDAYGPLVGTYLQSLGYTNVCGTIDDPTHAMNLEERVNALPKDKTIIAIDACLGQVSSVGLTAVRKGPVKPGAGVDKDLTPVGDYSIDGIVNVGGFMPYFVLQNTRLSLVMSMAKNLTTALMNQFPIVDKAVLHLLSK
jgi:putative sporulation protein YyaC